MSRQGGKFENSWFFILNTKDDTELKTYEKVYFWGGSTPGDDNNLAGLASFDFRIWRHVKTSKCSKFPPSNLSFSKHLFCSTGYSFVLYCRLGC